MSVKRIIVRVPATTANLGPGFDCLGLALDLWNETIFTFDGEGVMVEIQGYGKGQLPTDETNLIIKSFLSLFNKLGEKAPTGIKVTCQNNIPLGSGLGSSCAATLTGLFAANVYLGNPFDLEEILLMAADIEGHPDNAAAAAYGGLVACIPSDKRLIIRRYEPASWVISVLIPMIQLPTRESRAVLPSNVSMKDAVFNMGHTLLVVDAICKGDGELLAHSMQDRLHQPYRLKLIPGAEAVFQAALEAGAVAAAISGAGPGLVAFSKSNSGKILNAMRSVVEKKSVESLGFELRITSQSANVILETIDQ